MAGIDYFRMKAFATLTPANAEAQDAFSRVVDHVRLDQPPGLTSFSSFLYVDDAKTYNHDVSRHRRDRERPADEDNETATEPDTDTEQQPEWQQRGMVWSGCFYFAIQDMPVPAQRWCAGRLHDDITVLQFPLAVRHQSIRHLQAHFTLCKTTGCLQIQRPRKNLEIGVNGADVQKFHTLISGHLGHNPSRPPEIPLRVHSI